MFVGPCDTQIVLNRPRQVFGTIGMFPVECIKDERTALGLSNHVVGITTEGGGGILRGQVTPFILRIGLISHTSRWTTFWGEGQSRLGTKRNQM